MESLPVEGQHEWATQLNAVLDQLQRAFGDAEPSTFRDDMEALVTEARDISQIAVPADAMKAVDANPSSDFRKQQDARQSASFAPASGSTEYVSSADLSAAYGKGALVFCWDDGFDSWTTIAQRAKDRGQRHTFGITQSNLGATLSVANLNAMIALNAGHEFAQHSKTHPDMTTLTPAQRATESDKAWLEAYVGVGKVNTFVIPFGSAEGKWNATCSREQYLHYDRLLDTTGSPFIAAIDRFTQPFLVPRVGWVATTAGAEKMKRLVQLAANSPVTVVIYCHDAAGLINGGWDVEVMNLARDLGVPCITAAEAFPAQPSNILDAGFEDPNLGSWDINATAPNTCTSVADAPQTGYPGSRSLKIHQTSTSGQTYVSQLIPIEPSTAWKITYRGRVDVRAQGDGAAYAMIGQIRDKDGADLGTAYQDPSVTSSAWTDGVFSIPATANARYVNLLIVVQNADADFYVDHVHSGPATATPLG